jgi:hypothetical protein
MLFLDALAKLEAGIPMRRSSWAEVEGYLTILPGAKYVWKIILEPQPNAGNFIFCVADFTSNDWVEYTKPVEVPAVSVDAEVTPETA